METINDKTKSSGKMTVSRFRPKIISRLPAPAKITFIESDPINVTTAATPSEANKPTTAELLTIVLTVVVTVEIMVTHLLKIIITIEQAFVNIFLELNWKERSVTDDAGMGR